MYGKGWKKIASLIKTRTVVQIRTHAQKYFLKLSKSRQGCDTNVGLDGKLSLRKKKKKKLFKNIALSPFLQRYVKCPPESTSANVIDIDDSIYNFLSPQLPNYYPYSGVMPTSDAPYSYPLQSTNEYPNENTEDTSLPNSILVSAGNVVNEVSVENTLVYIETSETDAYISSINCGISDLSDNREEEKAKRDSLQLLMNCMLDEVEYRLTGTCNDSYYYSNYQDATSSAATHTVPDKNDVNIPYDDIPDWYKKGLNVESLLLAAESVNWLSDTGYPLSNSALSNTNTMQLNSSLPDIRSSSRSLPSDIENNDVEASSNSSKLNEKASPDGPDGSSRNVSSTSSNPMDNSFLNSVISVPFATRIKQEHEVNVPLSSSAPQSHSYLEQHPYSLQVNNQMACNQLSYSPVLATSNNILYPPSGGYWQQQSLPIGASNYKHSTSSSSVYEQSQSRALSDMHASLYQLPFHNTSAGLNGNLHFSTGTAIPTGIITNSNQETIENLNISNKSTSKAKSRRNESSQSFVIPIKEGIAIGGDNDLSSYLLTLNYLNQANASANANAQVNATMLNMHNSQLQQQQQQQQVKKTKIEMNRSLSYDCIPNFASLYTSSDNNSNINLRKPKITSKASTSRSHMTDNLASVLNNDFLQGIQHYQNIGNTYPNLPGHYSSADLQNYPITGFPNVTQNNSKHITKKKTKSNSNGNSNGNSNTKGNIQFNGQNGLYDPLLEYDARNDEEINEVDLQQGKKNTKRVPSLEVVMSKWDDKSGIMNPFKFDGDEFYLEENAILADENGISDIEIDSFSYDYPEAF